MAERAKEVEKMIAKVMKRKDLSNAQAVDYMLGVATGRLAALWRYDESLPEGKQTKGILQLGARKKRAPKSARISILPAAAPSDEKPKKQAKKAKSADKPAKKRKAPKKRKIDEVEPLETAAEE